MERNQVEENLIGIGTNSGKAGIVIRDSNQVNNNLESGIIIEIRLAQAGIRLAGMLNSAWCPAGEVDENG